MRTTLVRAAAAALVAAPLALFAPLALADTVSVDFENPPYSLGTINVQDGWSSLGAAGSGCAVYDHAVNSSLGVSGFGTQSLRISNAVTSGCFGDQTFSKSLANEAGETTASSSAMSGGTRQNHFEVQYQVAAATTTYQPGLFLSSSPDRGDGARMSYVGFGDQADGIHVIFYDYQDVAPYGALATPADGCGTGDDWVQADIATIDRTSPHTIKLTIDFVDGPRNDVVKVYVDGVLKKTGTSWEDYFRWCTESGGGVVGDANADVSRTVDSMLFRTGGAAAPATAGTGFLIDNFSLMSGPSVGPKVVIAKYVDGVHATAGNANSAAFPMVTSWVSSGPNGTANNVPFTLSPSPWGGIGDPYEATYINGQFGDNYATNEVTTSNTVVGSSCADGNPFALAGYTWGESWAEAAAAMLGSTSPVFTNLMSDKYVIVWNIACPTGPVPPPTNACATPTVAPQGWTLRNGTNKRDVVMLDPFTMFVGNGGNDVVVAGDGNYIVCTGSGNDTVKVGTGNSVIDTGAGNDTVKTGDGDMWVSTGDGRDVVSTGSGNDTIDLGSGNNSATSGAGNDTVSAGNGNDAVAAGAGTDTCNLGGGRNAKASCEL